MSGGGGRKKKGGHAGGGHGGAWIITFADLVALLMAFFVMIVSFSSQDTQKVAHAAGSIREAFGVQQFERRAGMIEIEGVPVRQHIKGLAAETTENDSEFADERHDQHRRQGREAETYANKRANIDKSRGFATAAASLRQALQELPEITEMSQHIMVEETPDGLNLEIMDQEGRSMFPEASRYPYEHTRLLLSRVAPLLRAMPNRIQIIGHTTPFRRQDKTGYNQWDLSAERANVTRQILNDSGIPQSRIHSVVGKADSEPLFPGDPFLSANRRITILLMNEKPVLPPDHKL